MTDSLWVIPDATSLKTPISILKEQASALTEVTRGTLIGEVIGSSHDRQILLRLLIKVPGLNNYNYEVCRYLQDAVILYPGTFTQVATGTGYRVENESGFTDILKQTLAHQQTQNAVASMIAQANSA